MDKNARRLTPQTAAAVNDVAAFLALSDFGPQGAGGLPDSMAPGSVDCIVLAGNCVLETAEGAFRALKAGIGPKLLITGGIGHATEVLRRKVALHPVYGGIATEAKSEAHILAEMAERFWSLDGSSILVEPHSTNSGENARFSRAVLERAGLDAGRMLLIQDPTMQRRADATFRHAWSDRPNLSILNWPTFSPRVRASEDGLRFDLEGVAGLWSMDRFLALVMGEIPRLRDDACGYGPKGKGFIAHVDIPEPVEAAYAQLKNNLAGDFGSR